MGQSRKERLSALMTKAAKGDFVLKDPETGEPLSPEQTQAEIMRRISAASEMPPEHEEKLAQVRMDDAKDLPRAIRGLNLQAEFEGVNIRFEMTDDAHSHLVDDDMQAMRESADDEVETDSDADVQASLGDTAPSSGVRKPKMR